MCHIFFIHSYADEHLGSVHVLAVVVNSAMVSIGVHVSLWINVFFDICSGVRSMDHMVVLLSKSLLRNLQTVLHSDCTNLYSKQSVGLPLHNLSSIDCRLSGDSHSDWCEVVVVLIFISPIISDVEHLLFFLFFSHLYVFFGEMSI